jgi:hypothetical protein
MSDIRHLFEPRSIAVMGGSRDPRKLGYRVLENIVLAPSRLSAFLDVAVCSSMRRYLVDFIIRDEYY